MPVYLGDQSAQTIVRAATLRQKLQVTLSTFPSHSIPTPGRPVPALTLKRQVPGTVATGVPMFKGATPGPRKQTSAGQGLTNISVITETGESWEGRCAGVSGSAKDGLTHRQGEGNERMPYNCYDSSVENNDISV